MLGTGITERLEQNPLRKGLIHHPFFKEVRSSAEIDREKVGIFLGQWWHPLHYFPHFLSRTIDQLSMLVFRVMNCCCEPLVTVPPVNCESAMKPPLA